MGFLRPKVPAAPAPPPPPIVEDTDAAKQEYQDRLRMRRGRSAAVYNDPTRPPAQQTAAKVLLGQ